MTSKQVRQQFLDFFAAKGHAIVDSSPVVPLDDPTLMFTNAGMNQFKDVFLGSGSRPYTRVADTQKCIRAGGKHNDLDDVGQDAYHHTFFEMLGNWSFGDYFKKEAIEWAWELLTGVWGIEKARLHATYFEGDASEGLEPDTEAAELWKSVTDIDPTHVHPGGKKDNFWEMGDTGPCGPCSEIHIDLTPDKSGISLVNAGDSRVIELWNLVFIQFNRAAGGKLTPLPARHVDTGMGFERLCAVLSGKDSNYDTDVWMPIFEAIQKRTGAPAYRGTLPSDAGSKGRRPEGTKESPESTIDNRQSTILRDVSYRVIADHVRCLTFAMTDGAIPDREGRGYVLRRILRRAVYYGRQYLNMHQPFLCAVIEPFVEHMADPFPGLRTNLGRNTVEHVAEMIREEEAMFFKTLDRGIRLFAHARADAIGRAYATHEGDLIFAGIGSYAVWNGEDEERPFRERALPRLNFVRQSTNETLEKNTDDTFEYLRTIGIQPTISGEDAFRLYDTFGFPIDLTELMAAERGLTVEMARYEKLAERARDVARGQSAEAAAKWEEQVELARQRTRRMAEKHQESAEDDYDAKQQQLEELRRQQISDWAEEQFARQHHQFLEALRPGACDDFPKYYRWEECKARLVSLSRNVGLYETDSAKEGQTIFFSTDRTCFYAEQGGQVSDVGIVVTDSGEIQVKSASRHSLAIGDNIVDFISHEGIVKRGEIWPGQECVIRVDPQHRVPTMKNHTSTHMLNWALRKVLGDHIQQKGSLVDPEKTRFDFSHNKPMTTGELARVEELVNERIEADQPVYTKEVEEKKAREINTLRAVFGEKYPDKVRVVSVGANIDAMLADPKNPEWMKYPVEFCGGTHLKRSSEAERFVITTEEAVAKGIRRVVGITSEAARQAIDRGNELLAEALALADQPPVAPSAEQPPVAPGGNELLADVGSAVRTTTAQDVSEKGPQGGPYTFADRVAALQQKVNEATIPVCVRAELRERIAELQKRARKQEKQAATTSGDAVMDRVRELASTAETIDGVTVIVGEVPAAPVEALRRAIDWVRNKKGASAVLLAMVSDNKVTLVAGMSKDVVKRGVRAGDLIKEVAPLVGGKGGGRPDMAQGGGGDPTGVPNVIERAKAWIGERLS